MALGKQIRYYRTKLKLTLEELAARSDVDVGTISALENRDSKRTQYGPALAQALGLTLDKLIDESRDWLDHQSARPPVTVLTAKSGANGHFRPWPFLRVSEAEYSLLTTEQRNQVEGFILGMVSALSKPRRAHNL